MIDNLVATLPESSRPALRQELDLLDRTIEKLYILPEDIALARIADSQGLEVFWHAGVIRTGFPTGRAIAFDRCRRQAMRRLISGIVEFRERQLSKYAERFRDLALAQSPDTLMVTCSDSRVVPDLLVSTHPGDLFTMRNVGNLIPPATAEGISIGDVSEASAIDTPY